MKLFIEFDEKGKTSKKYSASTTKKKATKAGGRKWLPREEWLRQQRAKQQTRQQEGN